MQDGTRSEVKSASRQAAAVTVGELEFAVDQYIVIGSPLGLFLALRKVRAGQCFATVLRPTRCSKT